MPPPFDEQTTRTADKQLWCASTTDGRYERQAPSGVIPPALPPRLRRGGPLTSAGRFHS
jgi:hypothetical protein